MTTTALDPRPKTPETLPTGRASVARVPRYTSYPTADKFTDTFDHHNASQALAARAVGVAGPLSVYVHVPFCSSLCYYCACNKVITQRYDKAPPYVRALLAEVDLIDAVLEGDRRVSQIHLGGGSPTFLNASDMSRLLRGLRSRFDVLDNAECSIEIDPRFVDEDALTALAADGFNRMSLGVQDFDSAVQQAINRVQSVALVARVLEMARSLGFQSTNFDLICGLPHQTPQSFRKTIASVVSMRPERVALYNYAHIPTQFRAQRMLDEATLPSELSKARIFDIAYEHLIDAGYVYIGMDHFAVPEDKLAKALTTGCLHRNFQGYTTQPECDLIGLGASAISRVGMTYSQNHRDIKTYTACVARGTLPTLRGIGLSHDDLVRRSVIMAIMCHGFVDKLVVEDAYMLDFDVYFARELRALGPLSQKGFVILTPDSIEVTQRGRHRALQLIGSVFDNHLTRVA
ncbi:MAG: oxygen-independent coproporphyrinogen III oxidase [Pseudomonadota bacterium]